MTPSARPYLNTAFYAVLWPAAFFPGYLFGPLCALLLLAIALLFYLTKKRSGALLILFAAGAAALGHLCALRDQLPVTEEAIVEYADAKVIRTEQGNIYRHAGTLVPRPGDPIVFSSDAVIRIEGKRTLSSFSIRSPVGLRDQLIRFIETHSDSHLLLAFTTGRRAFSAYENTAFIKTGTMHIVAISAFNIGAIFVIFLFLRRLLCSALPKLRPRRLDILLIILKALTLLYYLFITGNEIPTLRAALFIFIFDLCITFGKNLHEFFIFSVSLAATALLLPQSLTSMSFIMSAISVLTIFAVYRRLPQSVIAATISLTVVINLMLLPVTALMSGSLPLLAPLSNLIIIPIAALLVPLALAVQFLFPLSESLAAIATIPANLVADIASSLMLWLASFSGSALVSLTTQHTTVIILFYSAAVLAVAVQGWLKIVPVMLFIGCSALFFIPHTGTTVERIYALPGEAWCIRDESGKSRVVEVERYRFPDDMIKSRIDRLGITLERDLARCGITHLNSMHLKAPLPRKTLHELKTRPRLASTAVFIIANEPILPHGSKNDPE